jgi:hypothetical protein
MKLWIIPLFALTLCAQDRPPKLKITTAEDLALVESWL